MDEPHSRSAQTAEDLLADFLARRERGESVELEEYCRRHPALAEDLRRVHGDLFGLFEALDSIGSSWAREHDALEASPPVAPGRGPAGALSREIFERLSGRRLSAERYQIEGEIARGGMGSILSVWDEALRRRLAMKVILEDGIGPSAQREQRLARFLEEAQITGQLDHPGIVPIYELGVDSRGRVFFTMKLVKGRTLKAVFDEHDADEGGWTVTRLVQIVIRICEAMAFAHSKGVVHRDLKPANVMVGRFGEVYVMDWGLARVAGEDATGDARPPDESGAWPVSTDRRDAADSDPASPLNTMAGDVVGTPAYMAPEQALGRSREVDARCDVYAVGAILYHMLAGSMPYVPRNTTLTNRVVWLKVRQGSPPPLAELARDVPGELVAICERAMRREPLERYATMDELAEDLRAYIEGRVVRAYEAGALAQLRKWVLRNRALSAAFGLSGLLLFGALGALDYVQARDNERISAERDTALAAERQADQQRTRAEEEAAKAWASVDFLMRVLGSVRPDRMGHEVTVVEALRAAGQALAQSDDRPPAVRAAVHEILGSAYEGMGAAQPAVEHYRASLELRRGYLPREHHEVWRAMNGLGVALRLAGRYAESEELLREALELVRVVDGPEDSDSLLAANNLVVTLHAAERLDEAEALARDTLAVQRRVFGEDDADTVRTANSLATVLLGLGRRAEAGAIWRDLVERTVRVFGQGHSLALVSAQNYAAFLNETGDVLEAVGLSPQTLERMQSVFGPDHTSLRSARNVYARRLFLLGDYAAAEEFLRAELARVDPGLADEDPYFLHGASLLGEVLMAQGEDEEAGEWLWRALESRRRTHGELDEEVLVAKRRLAELALGRDDLAEAESMLSEVLAARRAGRASESAEAFAAETAMARLELHRGGATAACESLRRLVERERESIGADHPTSLRTRRELGAALLALGRGDEARAELAAALADARLRLGDSHPATLDLEATLAAARGE